MAIREFPLVWEERGREKKGQEGGHAVRGQAGE